MEHRPSAVGRRQAPPTSPQQEPEFNQAPPSHPNAGSQGAPEPLPASVIPSGVQEGDGQAHSVRPPRKDHRLAVQAEKLRLSALTNAIQFGEQNSSIKPRHFGILLGSLAIGLVILGGTIGGSALLQWIANR